MLPLHALVSRTLATLAKVDDWMLWCIHGVDRDLVERVLDDSGGHGVGFN